MMHSIDDVVANPLTHEERHLAAYVLEHDMRNRLGLLEGRYEFAAASPKYFEKARKTGSNKAVFKHFDYLLNWNTDVVVSNQRIFRPAHIHEFVDMLDLLKSMFREGAIAYEVNWPETDFPRTKGNTYVRYVALLNLVENGLRSAGDKGRAIISFSEHNGDIENPVFVPNGVTPRGRFVRINVNDNGPGFPKGSNPGEFMQNGKTTKEHGGGFGLTAVYLACKYLGSIIKIDSEPGNTNIAMYHPLNI